MICLWILSKDEKSDNETGVCLLLMTDQRCCFSVWIKKTRNPLSKRQAVQMDLMAMGCGVPWRSLLQGVTRACGSAGSRAVWALWDVVLEHSAAQGNVNGTTQPCRSQIQFFCCGAEQPSELLCAMLWK